MLKTAVEVGVSIDEQRYKVKVKRLSKKQKKELKKSFGEKLGKVIDLRAEIAQTYRLIELLERSGDRRKIVEKIDKLDELKARLDELEASIDDDEFDAFMREQFQMRVVDGDVEPLAAFGEEYGYGELMEVVDKAFEEAVRKK